MLTHYPQFAARCMLALTVGVLLSACGGAEPSSDTAPSVGPLAADQSRAAMPATVPEASDIPPPLTAVAVESEPEPLLTGAEDAEPPAAQIAPDATGEGSPVADPAVQDGAPNQWAPATWSMR